MQKTIYDNISPIDYRYYDEEIAEYLSEEAFIKYKLEVELALTEALHKNKICDRGVVNEIERACKKVTAEEVYKEEKKIHHDIRALVNTIRKKVSDKAKPYVHMTSTSFDISDTANAIRYQDAVDEVLIPNLVNLEKVLIKIALKEADTPQVGRTHGQHAVPITFGFAISEYVSRLGQSILKLKELSGDLRGKFSGAVGAYNASSLFFKNPEKFEEDVLNELFIKPNENSTQIAQPESLTRLLTEITIAAGIIANLADDMRHLQRTEIGEVGESFEKNQVGSSTMPQKRNPWNLENIKSMWKVIVGRTTTSFLDQISEHQRDLTNSASGRTVGESVGYLNGMAKRATRIMGRLQVDHKNLEKNLDMQKGLILAEPLYIILASLGHPNAHEKVRKLTIEALKNKVPLEKIILDDSSLNKYIKQMTPEQIKILADPSKYTGIASKKARKVANNWKKKLRKI